MSSRVKDWINEHIPMLTTLYQNKYSGMIYDRFASLPPKQQRQLLLGIFCGFALLILGYLFSSYLSLWSASIRISKSRVMVNMLQQYQKEYREKSAIINILELNNELATPGNLKQAILEQVRMASISPRMVQITEKDETKESVEDPKIAQEIKVRQANVKVQRINLRQLRDLLKEVEEGRYNLTISDIKVSNDDQLRGFMNIEMSVVAYLFSGNEEEQP